ncbi:MAG: hypothetical protein DIKNOCCD_02585 [bacterium]|nr:MAG: hypothetical protein UZ16_OP3001003524 [Candidatus Hinthialibacteria bacterium OLB16]MBV6482828.1 hypothetical protein [bacterium]
MPDFLDAVLVGVSLISAACYLVWKQVRKKGRGCCDASSSSQKIKIRIPPRSE